MYDSCGNPLSGRRLDWGRSLMSHLVINCCVYLFNFCNCVLIYCSVCIWCFVFKCDALLLTLNFIWCCVLFCFFLICCCVLWPPSFTDDRTHKISNSLKRDAAFGAGTHHSSHHPPKFPQRHFPLSNRLVFLHPSSANLCSNVSFLLNQRRESTSCQVTVDWLTTEGRLRRNRLAFVGKVSLVVKRNKDFYFSFQYSHKGTFVFSSYAKLYYLYQGRCHINRLFF